MSFEILGVDLYHILSWFIVYSFMGWIWESCYVSAKSKKWVNRGFVSGPFVTIYGVGAVTVYVILRPVAGNILELYFAGVAVATILEYVTGAAMERLFRVRYWDYSKHKFNLYGHICLGVSLGWGLFAVFHIDSVLYISAVRGKSGGNGSEKNRNRTGLCMAGRIYRGFCILCSSRFRSEKQDEEAGCCMGRISGEFAGYQTV